MCIWITKKVYKKFALVYIFDIVCIYYLYKTIQMTNTSTNKIEVFKSEFRGENLNVIFTKKSLWLSKKDICTLFEISGERLDYELMKIFSDGIFSRKENRERFLMWDKKKKAVEFFRLWVIISLGYRIKANKGTQYIIQTNRIIKTRLSKSVEVKRNEIKETVQEEVNGLDLVNKAIELVHSLRKQEIKRRMYA